MTNKSNGSGSVYQEKKSGRWIAAVTLTPDAHGRRRVKRKVVKTKSLANKALIELQIELSKKTLTLRSNETVAQFAERWLTEVIPLRGLKPSSVSNYQQMIHYYIVPTLGKKRLSDLKSQHVLNLVNSLRERGLSTNTTRRARSILHNMLEAAVEEDSLTKNPVVRTSFIKKSVGEQSRVQKSYSTEEVNRALEVLKGSAYEGPFRLMVCLGLRIGEVIALRWEQVETEKKQLWIVRTEAHIAKLLGDNTWSIQRVEGSTKSNRKRVLHLTNDQVDFLSAHNKTQNRLKFRNGESWNPEGYVFTTENGTPYAANNIRSGLKRVLMKNGLRWIRLHDLRHTAGFLAVEAGVGIEDVQDMLGHASIQITKDVYVGHVQAGSDRAVRALEDYIRAGSNELTRGVVNGRA
jgi:integrase